MSNTDEIRWRRRLENFDKTLAQLDAATAKDSYTVLERAGLVQIFEFTFELAWKTLKDLLFYEGYDVKTPRDVIRKGLEVEYLIEEDAEIFLDALDKRNLLSHTWDEDAAEEAVRLIKESYAPMLRGVHESLKRIQAS